MTKNKPNIFDRLAARWLERRSVSLTSPPQWLLDIYSDTSYSGANVTVEGSLSVTAVLAGFSILMEDTASLPLILYRRLDRGKERAPENPYYALMHDAPNPEHTSMVFREFILGHLLGWGNFYAQMIWDRRGVVRELWPLRPDRMEVWREDGERKYLYTQVQGGKRAFRADEILHIPAFGFDGLVGYSRISLSRNAIGLAMTAEEYGSKVFANGARPAAVLKHPSRLTDEKVIARLRADWSNLYQGASNAGRTAILEEGMDIKEIGFPPEDAQFLQTRSFQVAEIARIFRIPPHMLGDVERSTSWGSGIEQQEMGYLAHTLRPWLVRIEQQLNKDLLLTAERRDYFYEHLTDAMLRTDTAARYQAYTSAITTGWMTRNEAREKENLNPLDKLDTPLVPLNLSTAPSAPGGSAPSSRTGILLPIYQDALRRCLRREQHDLASVIKRGKLDDFYTVDHLDFIALQLAPVVAVHARLLDRPVDIAAVSTETARRICLEHRAQIAQGSDPAAIIPKWDMDPLAAQLADRSEL